MRRRAFVIVAVLAALAAALVATSISTAAPLGAASFNLYAGKTTDVGDVKVWNDATSLYVEIQLDTGWCMTESHVAAATSNLGIPQNSQHNPTPGQFPYGDTYSPCESSGDSFTIPLPASLGTQLYLAVHAEVWDESRVAAQNIYSDAGNTGVVSTTAPGGVLSPTAVDAWEPYLNADPSVWDTGVAPSYVFQQADWIWSDFRVRTPAVDETVTFRRMFTVPGPVAPGSFMKVTTDDAFTASLNGTPVASGAWPTWPTVKTASPFAPLAGANTLMFVATNTDDSYGVLGTPDNNPGGLIYESRVNYFTHDESAWAGTAVGLIQFNSSKSWATYFTFTPLPIVRISNNPQIGEGGVLGYTVALSGASALTTTVTIATVAEFSTAAPPGDYTTKTETLTFTPGQTTRTFSVQTNEDVLYEPATTLGPGEYVWAHITGGTNVSLPASQDFVSNLDLTDRWGLGFIVDDELAGDIWMGDKATGGVPDQHLTFSLDDSPDGGTYGYVNIDADPDLDYTGAPYCVSFDDGTDTLRFAYQIPAGEGGLTGLWIVWRVTDGGTITAGFSVVADATAAAAACANSGFAPGNSYTVYSGWVSF